MLLKCGRSFYISCFPRLTQVGHKPTAACRRIHLKPRREEHVAKRQTPTPALAAIVLLDVWYRCAQLMQQSREVGFFVGLCGVVGDPILRICDAHASGLGNGSTDTAFGGGFRHCLASLQTAQRTCTCRAVAGIHNQDTYSAGHPRRLSRNTVPDRIATGQTTRHPPPVPASSSWLFLVARAYPLPSRPLVITM